MYGVDIYLYKLYTTSDLYIQTCVVYTNIINIETAEICND